MKKKNSIEEHDTQIRSIIKTLTWRGLATLTTFFLVLIFTKRIDLALGIGIFDLIFKLILYYFHERIWDYYKWGKKIERKSYI